MGELSFGEISQPVNIIGVCQPVPLFTLLQFVTFTRVLEEREIFSISVLILTALFFLRKNGILYGGLSP